MRESWAPTRSSSRLSGGGEEAEQAWRIVDPVVQAWAEAAVLLLE